MPRHRHANSGPYRFVIGAFALCLSGPLLAATITVTSALDDGLFALAGNGTCDLREAIAAANTDAAVGECPAGSGADTIAFNIPGGGVHYIYIETGLANVLPYITSDITIDGYTQPGSAVNTSPLAFNADVRIAVISTSYVATGLSYIAGGTGTVRGLIIGASPTASTSRDQQRRRLRNVISNDGNTDTLPNARGVWVHEGATDTAIGSANVADRNLIAGSSSVDVELGPGAPNAVVHNNLIGTLADGDTKFPGASAAGVFLSEAQGASVLDNTIGAGAFGVQIAGSVNSATIARNRIGVGVNGGDIAGIGPGIDVHDTTSGAPSDILIGGNPGGNVIANWPAGVQVRRVAAGGNPTGVSILRNSIYGNGNHGIELRDDLNGINAGPDINDAGDADTGPNGFQNYPVVNAATTGPGGTTVWFTLASEAGASYQFEFFASPSCDASGNGEGRDFLGVDFGVTDGLGNFGATASGLVPSTVGHALTMTATRLDTGDTSEFSACLPITSAAATPSVELSANPLDFAGQNVGSTSGAQVVTVTNTGTATLNVGSVTIGGANAAEFGIASNTCGAPVAPAGICQIGVNFTPAAPGARSASMSIASDDPASPATVGLTGTGLAAAGTPPVMGAVPDRYLTVGVPFALDLSAYVTPTDGDPILGYVVPNGSLPAWASLGAATGVLSGTPPAGAAGASYEVAIAVLDDDGQSNSVMFNLEVGAAAPGPEGVTSVPTLGEWALLGLATLLGLLGIRGVGRGHGAT